jgi:hypothetical protein
MTDLRGFDPARRVDARQIDRVAGAFRKQLEILKLRPTVALAERMDEVHVADDNGCLFGELLPRQSNEESRSAQATMNIRHAGCDVLQELELLRALADLDRADFASPFVDILEQVAVDRLKMGEVQLPSRDTLPAARNRQAALHPVEFDRIGNTKTIFEYPRAGINVGVGLPAHFAAVALACSRM